MDRIDVSEFLANDRPDRPATAPSTTIEASKPRRGSTYNAFLGFAVSDLLASLFRRKKTTT
jgi:hypothetical protein